MQPPVTIMCKKQCLKKEDANLDSLGPQNPHLGLYFLEFQAAPGLREVREMLLKPLHEHPFLL